MRSSPSALGSVILLVHLMPSCSRSQIAIEDDSAVRSYLTSTTFVCHDQSMFKEHDRNTGGHWVLRFDSTDFKLAGADSKREGKASGGGYQLSSFNNDGREVTLNGASSSLDRMTLTRDGSVVLHLAAKEWKHGAKTLVFEPKSDNQSNAAVATNADNLETRETESQRYERSRFEEIFIGKPESFVRERLGEPAKWDLNGPFYKDGEQVFRKVVRYDRLVYSDSPNQVIPSVILKYDKDQGGNVTRVEYKY